MATSHAFFLPIIGIIIYLAIFCLIVYFVVKAVRKSFRLREEQNDLLRAIVEKMGKD